MDCYFGGGWGFGKPKFRSPPATCVFCVDEGDLTAEVAAAMEEAGREGEMQVCGGEQGENHATQFFWSSMRYMMPEQLRITLQPIFPLSEHGHLDV